jgi:TetR/AcrR family transcriptional regulator, regulator of autoinduction and epiphytic fitness
MLPPRAPEKRDGRRERSARTHKAIVASLIDLIEEGNVSPTAGQIARRASVAVRSIRQHFPSREDLFVAAVDEHARRVGPVRAYVDARLPLEKRVSAFAEARARELEFCAPVRRASSLVIGAPKSSGASAIGRAMDDAWQRRRHEVEQVFAAELDAHADRAELLDALDLLSHGRTWDTMRNAMQLTPDAATALLARSVLAVLTR